MPGKHDVYVFGDDSGFKVRPAVASATANGVFKIRNCTIHKIVVSFPPGVTGFTLLPAKPALSKPIVSINPGRSATVKIAKGADGVYPYTVHVSLAPGVAMAAAGESGPRIIIDP